MDKKTFFFKNENYIKKIVLKYYRKYNLFGFEFDDLYQTAALAIFSKYHLYDSNRGAETTFITFVVKSALVEYINRNIVTSSISCESVELSKKLFIAQEEYFLLNGRKMSYEEMIDYIKELTTRTVDKSYIDKLLYINEYCFKDKILELSEELEEDEGVLLKDTIESQESFEEEVLSNMVVEKVLAYLKKIEPIDSEILIEKYGLLNGCPKKYREMAKERHVSHQLLEQKIKRIEKIIEARQGTFKKLIK